jgi:hypothetical protein
MGVANAARDNQAASSLPEETSFRAFFAHRTELVGPGERAP